MRACKYVCVCACVRVCVCFLVYTSTAAELYAAPGPHDPLTAHRSLGGRRIDWATRGEPAPPVAADVSFLPTPTELQLPELPELPVSVHEATQQFEPLYAAYVGTGTKATGGGLREKLLAELPPVWAMRSLLEAGFALPLVLGFAHC